MHGDGILGVDFCSDRLTIVQMSHSEGGAVLDRWATVPLDPDAHPADVAATLHKTLESEGFTAEAAVFGLPEEHGYVQCFASEEALRQAGAISSADYVTDSWQTSEGRVIRGVAGRSDVTGLMEIAAQALVELVAVELRSMACVTTMGLSGEQPPTKPVLGFVIDGRQITLALADRQGLRVLESRKRENRDSPEAGLSDAGRMFRLAQMAGLSIRPAQARIICAETDATTLAELGKTLGVPVKAVAPDGGMRLEIRAEGFRDTPEYAAAIGLALEGLQHGAKGGARKTTQRHPFNFAQEPLRPRRKFRMTWLKGVAAVASAVVVAAGVLGYQAGGRRSMLAELEAQRAELTAEPPDVREELKLWQVVCPWVAPAEQGRRVAYRPALEELCRQFPPTEQAYVTSLDIRRDPKTGAAEVTLEGRSRDRNEPFQFVERLNASERFVKAQMDTLDTTPETARTSEAGSAFVVKFKVVFSLRQDSDV